MEKRKTLIINFLYFAIIIAIAYFVLEFAFTLLLPFVAALFIAYILRHPIRFLAAKTKLPKKLAAVLVVLLFYGTIGMLIVMGSIRAFSFISDLVQSLPQIYLDYVSPVMGDVFRGLEHAFQQADPKVLDTLDYLWEQLMQSMKGLVSDLSLSSMEVISGFASSLPMFFIKRTSRST